MAARTARITELVIEVMYKCPLNNDLACQFSFFLGYEKNLLVFDIEDKVI